MLVHLHVCPLCKTEQHTEAIFHPTRLGSHVDVLFTGCVGRQDPVHAILPQYRRNKSGDHDDRGIGVFLSMERPGNVLLGISISLT